MNTRERVREWFRENGLRPAASVSTATVERCALDLWLMTGEVRQAVVELVQERKAA